eukprot:Skav213012  [mRNA]  locus=scaffold2312:136430:137955:+ [translate_table: standard]
MAHASSTWADWTLEVEDEAARLRWAEFLEPGAGSQTVSAFQQGRRPTRGCLVLQDAWMAVSDTLSSLGFAKGVNCCGKRGAEQVTEQEQSLPKTTLPADTVAKLEKSEQQSLPQNTVPAGPVTKMPRSKQKLWVPRTMVPAGPVAQMAGERSSGIRNAESAKALLIALDKALEGEMFNFYQASAAYSSLAWWKAQGKQDGLQKSDWEGPVVARLHARVEEIVKEGELDPQATVDVLHSIAKFSAWPGIPRNLVLALAESLPTKLRNANQYKLSSCLWACGQLKEVAPDVLQAVPVIVQQIPDRVKVMDPQRLCACLSAALRLEALDIVPIIMMQAQPKVKYMSAQDLSVMLETMVLFQESFPEVALADSEEDIVRSAVARLKVFRPEMEDKTLKLSVPVILWACAKFGVPDRELMTFVARRFGSAKLSSLPGFCACALLWSYEELDPRNFQNFRERLRSEVIRRGFSQADVQSCTLGRFKWSGAKHP